MRSLWADYVRAYGDASHWLARYCPPWRWLTGLRDDIRTLRRALEE